MQDQVEPQIGGGSAVGGQPVIENVPGLEESKATGSRKEGNQNNAGSAEAQIAERGVVADNPRDALTVLAEGLVAGRTEKGKIVGLTFNLEETIDALKKSDNPLNKALGYDFEIAHLQYQLVDLNNEIEVALRQKKIDTVQAEALRKKFQDKIKDLQEERGKIVDKEGRPISQESQVSVLASKFAEGDDEKKQVNKNPLGLMERKFNEAMKDKSKREAFFQTVRLTAEGLSQEERNDLEEMITGVQEVMDGTLTAQRKQKIETVTKKALKFGAGGGVIFFLLAWLAREKKRGGGVMG